MNSREVYIDIINRKSKLCLVGLGYVGLPIAVSFARKIDVIGFDISEEKIKQYKEGIDPTREVGDDILSQSTVEFTHDASRIKEASFIIVAVPTPIDNQNKPDLTPLIKATELVARNMNKDSIVVFESTVYPGVTEDICVPILERLSQLKYLEDFKVGYSPERINPGDMKHRLENIVKVVSGCDDESLDTISKIYELVVDAGVFKATSIKVAEAAKVIENSQRDINIAFMNELSKIFHEIGIDTRDVLEAAATKWNFLNFEPGLVGGHCIGVDPYYLVHKAKELGIEANVILSGRSINDNMGTYIVSELDKLINSDSQRKKVGLMGFTFKENCPDTRNTKVLDIYNELIERGHQIVLVDPEADVIQVKKEYGINMETISELKGLDVLIIAVAHSSFKNMSIEDYSNMFDKNSKDKIIVDIKGILGSENLLKKGFKLWRL